MDRVADRPTETMGLVNDLADVPAKGTNATFASDYPGDLRQLEWLVESEMVALEDLLTEQLSSQYACVQRLMESASALHGKRLRPRLVLLSALACGTLTTVTRKIAAVVELVHAATLVHDDVLDHAQYRRGSPAAHVTWGNHASILLGDILFSKAFTLAASTGSCVAADRVGRAGQALCEGELRQQESIGHWDLSMDQYLDILSQKTGDLCAASSYLGACSAAAPSAWQQALEQYGMYLGIAFQIYDDWLDVWGTSAIGKPLGNDVANRKPTLPLLRLLATLAPTDRQRAIEYLECGQLCDQLREMLDGTDASDFTLDTARQFAQRACTSISMLPESIARHALIQVAQQSVNRRS